MSDRWTHAFETADHSVDPHYNGNGLPAFWTCHKCGGKVKLYGAAVPITAPVQRGKQPDESDMSAQP